MPHDHKKLDRIGHDLTVTLTTLAAKTSIGLQSVAITQNFQAALYQGTLALRGGTLGEIVAVYAAQGTLSQSEVEQAIEAAPLQSRDPLLEQTRRGVQLLGFVSLGHPLHLDMGNRVPMYRENETIEFWGYNPTSAALTTGGILSGQIWIYGRWKD